MVQAQPSALVPVARARLIACGLAVLIGLPVAPAWSDEGAPDLDAKLAELEPASWLRYRAGTFTVEGRYTPGHPDSLVLVGDEGRAAIARVGVDRLWVERRATRSASRTGLVVGAVVGTVTGILFAGLCGSFGDECPGLVPLAAGTFAGIGWFFGRVVGAAVPEWQSVYWRTPRSAASVPVISRSAVPPPRALAPRTGSYQLHAGYARSAGGPSTSGGLMVRGALTGWFRRATGVGFEAAHGGLGGDEDLTYGAGVLRLGVGTANPRRVDVVVGLGIYRWGFSIDRHVGDEAFSFDHSATFFGGTLGAGTRVPVARRLYGGLDLRLHRSLEGSGNGRTSTLWTLTAGIERVW